VRFFADGKVSIEEIRDQVLKVCRAFDKITADKVIRLFLFQAQRLYSSKPPLSLEFIKDRIILVLNLYDKVDPNKVRP